MGIFEYPRLSVYRNGGFLIRYRFTGESTRSERAAQQADRSWFLRGQQGKIKERQPRKTFGNMRFYAFLCVFMSFYAFL